MSITVKSFIVKFLGALAIMGVLAMSTVSSTAKSEMPTAVTDWYEALRTHDEAKFDRIMTSDARVDLRYLGIWQTKSEYIEALEKWAELAGAVDIRTTPVNISENLVELDVCYSFKRNQRLNRERFELSDGKIQLSTQELLSEKC